MMHDCLLMKAAEYLTIHIIIMHVRKYKTMKFMIFFLIKLGFDACFISCYKTNLKINFSIAKLNL